MQDAFVVVVFVVAGAGAIGALIALAATARTYDDIGSGGFFEDRPRPGGPGGGPDPARDEEIRQMLGARNARRAARGAAGVDVEAELAALTGAAADPGLEAEIREIVASRNRRRRGRGQPELDVEAEVARRLRELGT